MTDTIETSPTTTGAAEPSPTGPHPTVAALAGRHGTSQAYAYLDESSKKAVRRAILKALAIPGWQVPFASREMPVARGWGSGGLQVTLSLVGPDDTVKVIDQGDDESLNAAAMRDLVSRTSGATPTTRTPAATIVQSRHRLPDTPLRADQILVLQVPHPEPLRRVVPDEVAARALHLQGDYTKALLEIFDDLTRFGGPRVGADYPVLVGERRVMSPSPIPRHDVLRLDGLPHPIILGAGRRARITALPPHTRVRPLALAGAPLQAERAGGPCLRCGSTESYRVPDTAGFELPHAADAGHGGGWRCSDTDACLTREATR